MPEARIASRKRSGHSLPSDNRTHPRSLLPRLLPWTAGCKPRAVTPESRPKESFRGRLSARPGSSGLYALAAQRPRDVRPCSPGPPRQLPLSIASVFLLESVHAHHPPVIAERRGQAREREGRLPWHLSRWTSIQSRQALLVKTQLHAYATARLYFQPVLRRRTKHRGFFLCLILRLLSSRAQRS